MPGNTWLRCRHLTALCMHGVLFYGRDEDVAVLTEAVPGLRALEFSSCADFATDTGSCSAHHNIELGTMCTMPSTWIYVQSIMWVVHKCSAATRQFQSEKIRIMLLLSVSHQCSRQTPGWAARCSMNSHLDVSSTNDANNVAASGLPACLPQPMRQNQVPLPLYHLRRHQRVQNGPLNALGSCRGIVDM